MMEFDYMVHSAGVTKSMTKVTYEGQEIDAEVDTLDVELIPTHDSVHGGGTLTLRIKGKSMAQAREEFVADKTGKLTWTPSGKWHPGKGPDAVVVDGPHADPDQSEEAQRKRHGKSPDDRRLP